MFKEKLNRHGPEPYPNIWLFPDPQIFSLLTTFKGAQAWDIRRRVFYTNQAFMGRWLRN